MLFCQRIKHIDKTHILGTNEILLQQYRKITLIENTKKLKLKLKIENLQRIFSSK